MTLQEDEGQEESYVRIKILGKGAFGEAVLYRKPDNNLLVVWKEIDLNRVSSRSYVEVQNEIEILSLLNHANIVAYYNHYFHENMLYIEMEYANGGSLYHKIVSQTKLFLEEDVRWFLFQILSAVDYIHDKNILHRDIKTLNIFLNKAGLLKLGDFGMSKVMDQNVMADTIVGTPYYMSPELIKGQKYDAKSDIWAVGCVLHEMLTLTKTFMASNTLKLANDILKGEISPIDASYSSDMTIMVSKCFKVDPLERPSASELLANEIFKENEK